MRRMRWLLAVAVLTGAASLWAGRRTVLGAAGAWLVVEDPIAHVDLMVVSLADPVPSAVEIVRLYREGVGDGVLVPRWLPDDTDEETRRLDVGYVDLDTRVRGILARGGVPVDAVQTLPASADGTNPEAAAVAAFVRGHPARSLLVVTSRDHSARTRWLLRRALPDTVDVRVRSPREDLFTPTAWWRTREQSREVVMEYLRWMNVLVLGDPWARYASRES